jgi:hypothetical protein
LLEHRNHHTPDKLLPVGKTLILLRENPLTIAELMMKLDAEQLLAAPGEGEWSATEVLTHL